MKIALNTPVQIDDMITEVSQSRDTGRYSFIVVGGTAREAREAAEDFFALVGRKIGEGWAVTRPWGVGMLFGEEIPRGYGYQSVR